MKKLFIIGNGFDIAHGLHTSYEDFRKFLCEEYMVDIEESDILIPPEVCQGAKGDLIFDTSEVAAFLVQIISEAEPQSEYWSDLESSLGRLDYSDAFDTLPEEFDEDGDLDEWNSVYNNEDMASTLMTIIPYIRDFFSEWVETIELCNLTVKSEFQKLLEKTDLFLTFNYTETLEQCYPVEKNNICHIHGKRGQEILFGHGDDKDYTDDYISRYIGAENTLSELDMFLRKDTGAALKRNLSFFQRIDSTIDEIYTIGFSFAEVDLIYIKEVCKRLSDETVWYLNDYDVAMIPIYEKKIKQCGFRGTFATFSI